MAFKRGQSGNPSGRKPGTKNATTLEFQKKWREMCQRVLDDPKVEDFMRAVISGEPIEDKTEQVWNSKTKKFEWKKVKVPASLQIRLSAVNDLRDGGGARPATLAVDASTVGGADGKPSYNIHIEVV